MTDQPNRQGDGGTPTARLGAWQPDQAHRGASARGHPGWTLVAIAFGVVMVGIDATVVAVANPYIAHSLHGSLSDLQWITNAYLLVLAVALIPMGMLGDRFGRRRLFLIGVAGFALSSLAVGQIGSVAGVIAFRAVQGVFGAIILPNTLAILRNTFPPEKLNRAIGVWGGSSAVSIAAGPIVGGLLVEHVSWQSVFYINVPIGALGVVIGLLALAESRDRHPRAFDAAGLVVLAGGLFCVVLALIKAETWGWGDAKTIGLLVGGLGLLVVLGFVERRVHAPLLPPALFTRRSLTLGTTAVTLAFFAMYGVLFFVTLYLENVHGYDPVAAGVRLLPLTAIFAVAAPAGALMNDRLGPRFAIPFGMVSMTVALVLLLGLHPESGFIHLWPSFVLLGLGVGVVVVAASDAIVASAPPAEAGIAGGIQATGLQLGGVLGTSVLGSILTSQVGSTLVGNLQAAGVPTPLARRFLAAKQLVAQGLAPHVPGAPAPLQAAVTGASHQAFMSGLHLALAVAAGVCLVTAVLGVFVERPEPEIEAPADEGPEQILEGRRPAPPASRAMGNGRRLRERRDQ
ncbi:MAG: MFS transporter [Actinomycetota bacterium]|nr:MFS transporter [Actinomycetota bacterium]